jgi:hypothetical protein
MTNLRARYVDPFNAGGKGSAGDAPPGMSVQPPPMGLVPPPSLAGAPHAVMPGGGAANGLPPKVSMFVPKPMQVGPAPLSMRTDASHIHYMMLFGTGRRFGVGPKKFP